MSTAVANQEQKPTSIKGWLQSEAMQAEVAKALPKHMRPERMMRVAMTCLTRVPKLAECTPASFMQCLLSLSQWGLEPDGRRAHLIPFENRQKGIVECTLIIDYKAWSSWPIALARSRTSTPMWCALATSFSTTWALSKLNPMGFRCDAGKPAVAGDVYAVYCIVTLEGDLKKCEVMTRDDVEGIRLRSKAGKSGP